ncbi:MAG: hypothetical protein H5U04_07670 [Firmicutes bacterium]|nr:hypothetical protein [Bacillota bacterium]
MRHCDLLRRIPEEVMMVARRLRGAGHAVFVVGGAVRDLVAGRQPADWDLATSARPEQMRPLFSDWRVIDVGARHGTLGLAPTPWPGAAAPPAAPGPEPVRLPAPEGASPPAPRVVQVTTFRVEGPYGDRRHPDYVRFVDTLYEDLSRRDFTVNALALDPFTGDLHDPQGGVRDLRLGLVRAVGEAEARFREDALRLLRAFRLVAEYGWEIEPSTARAIEECAPLAGEVASERVRVELERIIRGVYAGRALALMVRHRLLGQLFPGLRFERVPWGAIDRLPPRVDLRLAALLRASGEVAGAAGPGAGARGPGAGAKPTVRGLLTRWRFPTRVVDSVVALAGARVDEALLRADGPALRRWISEVGRERAADLALILRELLPERGEGFFGRVRGELERGVPVTVEELPVSGRDVMDLLGLAPGPEVGAVLRDLLASIWDDPSLNDRETLLQLLRRRAPG